MCVSPSVFEFARVRVCARVPTQTRTRVRMSVCSYARTAGVGGVVVNAAGEVLMVQERVSPLPQFQGSWKVHLASPATFDGTLGVQRGAHATPRPC